LQSAVLCGSASGPRQSDQNPGQKHRRLGEEGDAHRQFLPAAAAAAAAATVKA